MSRAFVQIILPLVAPLVVYFLWLRYARKRAETTGDEPPAFTRGGAFWMILLGFVLAVASLAFLAVTGSVGPDAGTYQPPRFEDGKVIGPSYGD